MRGLPQCKVPETQDLSCLSGPRSWGEAGWAPCRAGRDATAHRPEGDAEAGQGAAEEWTAAAGSREGPGRRATSASTQPYLGSWALPHPRPRQLRRHLGPLRPQVDCEEGSGQALPDSRSSQQQQPEPRRHLTSTLCPMQLLRPASSTGRAEQAHCPQSGVLGPCPALGPCK